MEPVVDPARDHPAGIILAGNHRNLIEMLEREEPLLRRAIIRKPVIAVQMIGGDIGQHRNIARKTECQVNLITRKLQHIDPALRQGIAAKDRKPDIPAHQCRDARRLAVMGDQRCRRRFAVGPRDPDHLVRRKAGPGEREEFDIANDGNTRRIGVGFDRMGVERDAGRDDNAVEAGEVNCERVCER
jgi:hypothetical protein